MPEIWKPVVGFEADYAVSSEGRIASLTFRNGTTVIRRPAPSVLKARPNGKGYLRVELRSSSVRRTVFVHRTVLAAFVGPCPALYEASHEDGDRTNNRLTNLRWRSRSANAQLRRKHGTALLGERNRQAKLTAAAIPEIRRRRQSGETLLSIARDFGVSDQTISNIAKGRRWTS